MIFNTSAYLLTLAFGLPLVGLTFFIAGRRRHHWPWRAGISALLAATIAPTASLLYGEMMVSPAIWMFRILFLPIGDILNRVPACLALGGIPDCADSSDYFWLLDFVKQKTRHITMKLKPILCFALILSGDLFGCSQN